MTYHYYIGLQLPDNLRTTITQIQQELFDPTTSIEPLEPHITLLPPPAVETINPDELRIQAKAVAARIVPFDINLTSIITFNDHAVAIAAASDALLELQRQLVSLLPFETDVTYYPQPEFTPHVTLVQAIHGHRLTPEHIQRYEARVLPQLPMAFTAEHLTLFEWLGPRQYNAQPL